MLAQMFSILIVLSAQDTYHERSSSVLDQLLARTQDRSAGLLDNTSGIFVSGDPGSGKSVFGRELVRWAADSGEMCVIVLDPAPGGDLAEDCLRDASDMGSSVRDHLSYFFPGNPKLPIGAINPLHVDRDETTTDYEYDARLECRVSLAARLLLNVFGQDSFDGAPQMYKYTTTILRSAARIQLSLADCLIFFDTGSDWYDTLLSCIPERMAQMELERLAAMKFEHQEELIGSTKHRFVGLLSSPVVKAHLGCVEQTVPVRKLIASQALVYVNLSMGQQILSEEAQSLLANIWLSELFHVQFTTPRELRKPLLIVCDELPRFRASAP